MIRFQSYSLIPSKTSVNEGETFSVTLATTGVAQGTKVGYTVTGVSQADLSAGALTGSFTIQRGFATVNFTLKNDNLTEGTEVFKLALSNGKASVSITVNDTSKNLPPPVNLKLYDSQLGVQRASLDTSPLSWDTISLGGATWKNLFSANDSWYGMPPGFYEFDSAIPVVNGNPSWWATLAARGVRANGVGALLEYSGGVSGYFDEFMRDNITKYFISSIVPPELRGTWDGSTLPPQSLLDLARGWNGVIILDDEFNWPSADPEFTRSLLLGPGMQAFRRVLDRVYGSVVSDSVYESAYKKTYGLYLSLVHGQLRSLFPLAKLGRYGYPYGSYHSVWTTPSQTELVKRAHRDTSLTADYDVLCPSFYMYYKVMPDTGVCGVDGDIHQSTWIHDRLPYAEEVYQLKGLFRKPVLPFTWALQDPGGAGAEFACKGLDPLNTAEMLRLCDTADADGLIAWGHFDDNFRLEEYNKFYGPNGGGAAIDRFSRRTVRLSLPL